MIVGAYPPAKCGVGDYTERLCKQLAQLGVQVSVITSVGCYNDNTRPNLTVYPVVGKWDFSSWHIIDDTVRQINPDIVHIQYPTKEYGRSLFINLLPGILKERYKVKVLETVHEYYNYTFKGRLRNQVNYLASDAIIIVEKDYRKLISSFLPFLSRRLNFIYIPISSNIPVSSMDSVEAGNLRRKIGSSKEELLLSYFGFISPPKGFDLLLQSLCLLKEEGIKAKLLAIAELNLRDSYHQNLLGQIKEMGLAGNIIWTGFVENPQETADYLAVSDICVLPFLDGVSERNGSFLAALNQGIPIVTTSNDQEGYNPAQNTLYVKPGDAGRVTEAVHQFRKVVGIHRIPNSEILSWEEIAGRTLAVYKELTEK